MSTFQKLQGWNIGITKRQFKETGENGQPKEVDGYRIVFTEVMPPSGNQIIFDCHKEIWDKVVQQATGVFIPELGDLPRL